MVKTLTLIGFALIVSAVFVAVFLNGPGNQCLPSTLLGVATPVIIFPGFKKDDKTELAVLEMLVAATKIPSRKATYEDTLAADLAAAKARYCPVMAWNLFLEISTTICATLAVGFWTARRKAAV